MDRLGLMGCFSTCLAVRTPLVLQAIATSRANVLCGQCHGHQTNRMRLGKRMVLWRAAGAHCALLCSFIEFHPKSDKTFLFKGASGLVRSQPVPASVQPWMLGLTSRPMCESVLVRQLLLAISAQTASCLPWARFRVDVRVSQLLQSCVG